MSTLRGTSPSAATAVPALSIMPQLVVFSESQRQRCIEWLYEIQLIKRGIEGIASKLPRVCKNGVIYIDIINRLEGKDTIPGVNRAARNATEIRTNFRRVFRYLRTKERMNPRFLDHQQAESLLIEGDQNIFWAFLDDIWHLYHAKISPFDSREKKTTSIPQQNRKKSALKKVQRKVQYEDQVDRFHGGQDQQQVEVEEDEVMEEE